jgi:subtilisin family serine protease
VRGIKTLFAFVVAAALIIFVGPPALTQAGHSSAAQSPRPMVVARLAPEAYRRLAPGQVVSAIDYGGFVWVEMTPEQAEALQQADVPYEPQPRATQIGLLNYPFDTREGEPAIPADLRAAPSPGEEGLYLVQFAGPTRDEWLQDLERGGVRVLQYVPEDAYLVWGRPAQVHSAEHFPGVRWAGVFYPAYKIAPSLANRTGLVENVSVLLYDDGHGKDTLAAIEQLGGRYVQDFPLPILPAESGQWIQAIFALDAAHVADVARLGNVFHLEYASPRPGLDDEIGDQIVAGNYTAGVPYPGYQSWLTASGADGSGVRIADVDTGCDTNDNATAHQDIRGRIAAFVDYSGGAYPTDDNGHGTHTAGIVAGNAALGIADPGGFLYGLGVAPGAQLVVQNALQSYIWPPSGGWQRLSKDSVLNGAVASSNSWYTGAAGAQGYSAACASHDRMVRDANFDTSTVAEPLIMVFSAGNDGPGASTITEPKEAKNLIVVGASENYRPDNPLGSGCGASSNIERVVGFSSRGPTLDGRLAPTLVAPGSDVASLRSYSGSYGGCGQIIGGRPDYVYMSGTSMACPHVSGAVALITDWWKGFNEDAVPSPAMVKALLVNGATDMGTADIPNNDEGWGRMNLNNVIDNGAAMIYRDQEHLFTASGETWALSGSVADPAKPLRITLVWTDAPGMVGSNAWVNNLDLEVTVGSTTYKGNAFANGWSTAGGSADYRNNVENVYVQNPHQEVVNIRVTASNIAGDGVPYNGDATDQDFALVAYNMVVEPDFTLSALPTAEEVCTPQVATYSVPVGSVMGYSQTVTLSLGGAPVNTPYAFAPLALTPPLTPTLFMTATGATPAGTHHLVITGTGENARIHTAEVELAVSHAVPPAPTLLSPGDGVSAVPLLPTFDWSAAPEATSYRIQACTDVLCTTPAIDASGLTTSSYTAETGLMGDTCYFWRAGGRNGCGEGAWSDLQRFETVRWRLAFWDDMEAGNGQWSHAASHGVDAWALTIADARSPSHAWFSPDVATVTDDSLWHTAPFAAASGTTLTFWHRYDLEAYGSSSTGYDGGVIEISADGGSTWQDLEPYITQNPYDHTISAYYASPIAGRQAWSGDSGSWQQVEVDLSFFAGQNVQVRWRLACDNSVARVGWYVDDVKVITPLPPNGFSHERPLWVEVPVHFTATVSGSYTYTWDFGGPGTGLNLDTATPTFTYTATGDYIVQLNLENLCVAEIITHEVSVHDRLVYYVPLVLDNP